MLQDVYKQPHIINFTRIFLGGRELGGLLLAMTMIATYGSASSFIGGPVLLTIWGLMGIVVCDSSCNRIYRFNGYR